MIRIFLYLFVCQLLISSCSDSSGVISTWENGTPKEIHLYAGDSGSERVIQQLFNAQGTKVSEGELLDGNKNGTWKSWHPNGQLHTIQHYRNGVPIFDWLTYSLDGELIGEQNYSYSSTLSDNFLLSDDSGFFVEQGKYDAGRRVGTWVTNPENDSISKLIEIFDNEGKPQKRTAYYRDFKGMKHETVYQKEGLVATAGTYINDKKHGFWIENDKMKSWKGRYLRDVKVGIWDYFEDGNIKKSYLYQDTIPILVNYWNEEGIQTLKDGNGVIVYREWINSYYSLEISTYFKNKKQMRVRKRRIKNLGTG